MTPLVLRRDINCAPYTFTWDAANRCWNVCPAGVNPIERMGRAYAVYVDAAGAPLRCSCPHATHAGARCKHLKAAAELQRELNPEALVVEGRKLVDAARRAGASPEQLAALRGEVGLAQAQTA